MDEIILGLCILCSIAAIWYFCALLPDMIQWWKENFRKKTFTGRLLRFIVDIPFYIFKLGYWIVVGIWLILQFFLTVSLCLGLPALIIMTIYEQFKKPSIGFIIFLICIVALLLIILSMLIYNKVYGNTKATAEHIKNSLEIIEQLYMNLYKFMELLNHTGSAKHAYSMLSFADSIIEDSNKLCELLSDKSIKKYIAEDECIMIFKSIKKETEHIKELCSEIETKFHGKSRLILPKVQIKTQTETDVLFLMLKVRRATSKGKFYPYPSKIRRTKTTEVYTNEFGEITHESKPKITYTILDFYFYRNNERKPIRSDAQNKFNSAGEKSFLTSEKNNEIDYYEVIFTDKDATKAYRQCQMIDTVRKVAEDENLLKSAKKALKGLKLSYNKE